MKTISVQEFKAKQDQNENFQLIDVREYYEFDEFNIGGINIPLDSVLSSTDKIEKDKPVVFCCNSGKRSKAIVLAISKKLNLTNLYSLNGGVAEYREVLGL